MQTHIILWKLVERIPHQRNVFGEYRQVELEFAHDFDTIIRFHDYEPSDLRVFNLQSVDYNLPKKLFVKVALLYLLFFQELKKYQQRNVSLSAAGLPVMTGLINEEPRDLRVSVSAQLCDHIGELKDSPHVCVHHLWVIDVNDVIFNEAIDAFRHLDQRPVYFIVVNNWHALYLGGYFNHEV